MRTRTQTSNALLPAWPVFRYPHTGVLYAWGHNAHGQCGTGDADAVIGTPTIVAFPQRHVRIDQVSLFICLFVRACDNSSGRLVVNGRVPFASENKRLAGDIDPALLCALARRCGVAATTHWRWTQPAVSGPGARVCCALLGVRIM